MHVGARGHNCLDTASSKTLRTFQKEVTIRTKLAVGFLAILMGYIVAAEGKHLITSSEETPTGADDPALYATAVELLGTGAHRQLALHMPSASQACPKTATAASLCILLQLPPVLYFDPYELDRVLPKQGGAALTRTVADLEMPEVASAVSSALLELHLPGVPSVAKIPLHSKYAIPSLLQEDDQGTGRRIQLKQPQVGYRCSLGLQCQAVVDKHGQFADFKSPQEWIIPEESVTAIYQVASLTQLFQCLCTVGIVMLCVWRRLHA